MQHFGSFIVSRWVNLSYIIVFARCCKPYLPNLWSDVGYNWLTLLSSLFLWLWPATKRPSSLCWVAEKWISKFLLLFLVLQPPPVHSRVASRRLKNLARLLILRSTISLRRRNLCYSRIWTCSCVSKLATLRCYAVYLNGLLGKWFPRLILENSLGFFKCRKVFWTKFMFFSQRQKALKEDILILY